MSQALIAFFDYFLSDAGQRLIQNVIAVAAIFFAVRGVRNWNRERRDLRRAELAEQTLAVAYRVRDGMSYVRSPFSFVGEGTTRKQEENESEELKRQRDAAFVPVERLNSLTKDFEEIQSLRYLITAAFGEQAATTLLEFIKIRNEINHAAGMRYATGQRRAPPTDAMRKLERQCDATIWEDYDMPDQIKVRLDRSIEQLERTFRPHVEARFRTMRFIPSWNWFGRGKPDKAEKA